MQKLFFVFSLLLLFLYQTVLQKKEGYILYIIIYIYINLYKLYILLYI